MPVETGLIGGSGRGRRFVGLCGCGGCGGGDGGRVLPVVVGRRGVRLIRQPRVGVARGQHGA